MPMYRPPLHTFFVILLACFFVQPLSANNKRKDRRTAHRQKTELLEKHQTGEVTLEHKEYIDLLNELAIFYRFKDSDCLAFYAAQALRDNSMDIYPKGYMTSEIYLTFYYSEQGEYAKALKRYQAIKKITDEMNDPDLSVTLLRYWSLHDSFSGAQKELIEHNYESIAICQKYGFIEQEAALRHNWGWTYFKYDLHDKAHQEYVIADSLWQVAGLLENAAYTRSNIALNALENEDYETFHKYRKSSLPYLNPSKDPLWSSRAYRIYAQYFLKMGQLDSTQYWIDKSQDLVNLLNNKRDQLELFTLYTKLFTRQQKLDTAETTALAALDLSRRFKDSLALVTSYEQYKDIAMLQGDQEKTYALLLEYTSLKSNFDKAAANRNLDFLRAQHQYDSEKASQELALAEKNWVIIGVLFLLGCVSVILYLARKNYANQKAANKELSQLNASKDKLFSIISHDLISPINTLKEMLALYKDNVLTESEVLDSIPRLKTRVDMSSFTLNNLLYWAQTQMSGFKSNPKSVDLKDRASLACSLFTEEIKAKDLLPECAIPIGYNVWFDINHLDVILRNLVSNAIKFSPLKGRIQFKIEEKDNQVIFTIRNEGEAVPEHIIFALKNDDNYTSTPGTKEEKGTGVGLKISKELTELNGGSFEIFADPKGGTRVRIRMPKAAHLKAVV